MKKVILFTAILSLVILNACGGKQLAGDGQTNENSNSLVDGQKIQVQNIDPNTVNMPGNSNMNVPNGRVITNGPADPNFKGKPMEMPAAYNSTMSTTMNKDGKFLETRAFKDDPQILKLERMQELKTFKLYLKNGKVIELPYEKAENLFLQGSPSDLLLAAGIKPAATPPVSRNPAKEQLQKQILTKP